MRLDSGQWIRVSWDWFWVQSRIEVSGQRYTILSLVFKWLELEWGLYTQSDQQAFQQHAEEESLFVAQCVSHEAKSCVGSCFPQLRPQLSVKYLPLKTGKTLVSLRCRRRYFGDTKSDTEAKKSCKFTLQLAKAKLLGVTQRESDLWFQRRFLGHFAWQETRIHTECGGLQVLAIPTVSHTFWQQPAHKSEILKIFSQTKEPDYVWPHQLLCLMSTLGGKNGGNSLPQKKDCWVSN